MRARWWVGTAAGVALGLATVLGVEAATGDASARSSITVSAKQLKTNQRIAQAALKRSNVSRKRLNKIGLQLPMWAVSSGAPGSNLVRGDGAVLSQFVGEGNYRVRFVRPVSACTWSATPATEGASLPDAFSIRVALDVTEPSRTQLIVRTNNASGQPANSGFHLQVFC
jgi:hypothetical protein